MLRHHVLTAFVTAALVLSGAVWSATATTTASSDRSGGTSSDSGSASSRRYVEFRSPSRNILCSIVHLPRERYNVNRCDIRRKTFHAPPRPRSCPDGFGWGKNFWVSKRGRFVCASETATVSTHPPTLQYGDSMRLGHIRCTSRQTGMVCRNLNTDHGYKLARDRVRFF